MAKYVIGIDPDSKAHGVAVYKDGKLFDLTCEDLPELTETLKMYDQINTEVHIENVCATKAVWHKGGNTTAVNVGKCHQAQVEVERFCEYLGFKVVRHKTSKAWKKNKKQFELVTGWKGRSNEDTRSAAYFGWLGVKS